LLSDIFILKLHEFRHNGQESQSFQLLPSTLDPSSQLASSERTPTMPPAKASRAHDDAKGDGTHTEKKNGGGTGSAKMRRITSQTGSAASQREAANAPTSAPTSSEQTAPGVSST
jgi:hypothetical protein